MSLYRGIGTCSIPVEADPTDRRMHSNKRRNDESIRRVNSRVMMSEQATAVTTCVAGRHAFSGGSKTSTTRRSSFRIQF